MADIDSVYEKLEKDIRGLERKKSEYEDKKDSKEVVGKIDELVNVCKNFTDILNKRKESATTQLNNAGIADPTREMLAKYISLTEEYLATNKKKTNLEDSIASQTRVRDSYATGSTEWNEENAKITALNNKLNQFNNKLQNLMTNASAEGLGVAMQNFANNPTIMAETEESIKKEVKAKEDERKIEKELAELEGKRADAARKSAEAAQRQAKVYEKIKAVFGEIKDQAMKAGTVWMDFNQQAISDAKRLGLTSAEAANAYNTNLMANSKELMRNFGLTREEATKMQETFQSVTGKAIQFNRQQMDDIASASNLMGKENVAAAIQSMDAMGSSSDRAVELMDATYARAKNSGLDATKASEAFVKNMSLANSMSFSSGVDGISRMTILSQKLKFNLESVKGVADKFSTIEGAIQGSAELQVLGGTASMYGANPMQMLYESLNDTEGLTERLTKMFGQSATFNRQTGEADLKGFNLAMVKAQAKAAGLNEEEAVKMAKNQARINDMEATNPDIVRKFGKDSEAMSAIENRAQYSKESGWTVTWNDKNGNQVTKRMSEIGENDVESIQGDILDPVQDIKGNVRQIATTLISLRDRKNSFFGMFDTSKAQMVDTPMKGINGVANDAAHGEGLAGSALDFFNDSKLLGGTGVAIAGGMLYKSGVLGNVLKRGIPNLKGISNIFKGFRSIGPGSTPTPSPTPNPIGGFGLGTGSAGAVLGAGATGAIVGGAVGYGFYSHMHDQAIAKAASETNRFTTLNNNDRVWERRGVNNDVRSRAIEGRKIANENRYSKDQGEAVGTGVGIAGGAAAGAAIGAAMGFGVFSVPTALIGAGVGALGGWLGGKIGRGTADSKENKSIIGKEMEEINDADEEENIRKIVLPVESIDYNVSLIANQLGIMSAMPAQGNIYLDAEAAGETGVEVSTQELQASYVNNTDSQTYYKSSSLGGNFTLTVSGSIDLRGGNNSNIGQISGNDLNKLLENTNFQNSLKNLISKALVETGSGRASLDSVAATSSTGIGGVDGKYNILA